MTALSHSTRRLVYARVAHREVSPRNQTQHESDVAPYVPLSHRKWDADSETFQPVRAPERE